MDSEVWYYKVGEEKSGPVSHRELQAMLDKGEIDPTTKVWKGDFSEWIPISDVEHFNMATLDETPTITVEKKVDYTRETDQDHVRPRPWIRFWARMIDYSLFILIIGFLIGFFNVNLGSVSSFSGMLMIFLWTFIEAFLLATWGTTPGKWFLKVWVRDEHHHKLSFSEGMSRSFSVWWLGMGAGIPIVSLITMIVAAVKLSNKGETTWDGRRKLKVFHDQVGLIRSLVVILYFLCYVWIIAWGQYQMMNRT
ncbi:MAG: RDD family protein [Chlamydiia bacterium]|nr:RDD family protein [Chlamydiia bacterium]